MGYSGKAMVAALMLGLFGIFLIWQGITGNVIKTIDGKTFIPRWMYVLCGIVVLILPTAYLIVLLQVK